MSPQRLSVYGILLLQGAMAAARIGDSATVADLLNGAQEAALMLGSDENHYWTSFGPTNVELHRAAAAVELGDGGRAVEIHRQRIPQLAFNALLPDVGPPLLASPELRPIGDVATPARCVAGDRLSPSEIRFRPIATSDVRHPPPHPRCALSVAELAGTWESGMSADGPDARARHERAGEVLYVTPAVRRWRDVSRPWRAQEAAGSLRGHRPTARNSSTGRVGPADGHPVRPTTRTPVTGRVAPPTR